MNRSSLIVLAVALIAAVSLTLMPARPSAAADRDEEVISNDDVRQAMAVLTKNQKALRKQMRDPAKNADSANKLSAMLDAAVLSKQYVPSWFETQDQKKSYRIMMNKFIITLVEAENAALQDEQEKLLKQYEIINAIKEEAHKTFLPFG